MAKAANYKAFWDNMATPVHAHASEYWFDRYAKEILVYLSGAETVVDAGCGSGEILMRIAPYFKKIIALDYSESMLNSAKRKMIDSGNLHVHLHCDNLTEIHKYCDEEVDAVYCNGVIQYLNDTELADFLRRTRAIIKQDGRVLLMNIPNVNSRILFRLGYYRHEKRVSFLRILKGLPHLYWKMLRFKLTNGFKKYDDGIGNWFSIEMINTIASTYGFTAQIYGTTTVNYYYRFHALLTPKANV